MLIGPNGSDPALVSVTESIAVLPLATLPKLSWVDDMDTSVSTPPVPPVGIGIGVGVAVAGAVGVSVGEGVSVGAALGESVGASVGATGVGVWQRGRVSFGAQGRGVRGGVGGSAVTNEGSAESVNEATGVSPTHPVDMASAANVTIAGNLS
jgi:hypothetical protein